MLKKIICVITLVFSVSSTFAFPTPNAGDVFSGNSSANNQGEQFGSSPSVCNDPQISRIEQETNTTARVFEYANSGTKEGLFGRWLETNEFVLHTGVCIGKPGSLVMFIYKSRVPEANKIANELFSANSRAQIPYYDYDLEPSRSRQPAPAAGATPCLPFGKGGYDYCANPEGTLLPPGCVCDRGPLKGKEKRLPVAPQSAMPCAPKNLEHLRLYSEPWLNDAKTWPVLKRSLQAVGATIQSNKLARGNAMAFDEYSITISRMPYGYTPEQMILDLAKDFNGTLDRRYGLFSDTFAKMAHFKRRAKGALAVGELVDINIPLDPGTVQLVELRPDHFVYQTVTSQELGSHPVSGAREFGFWRNGSKVVFYTRGADRPYIDALRYPGMAAQHTTWQSYVRAVGEFITRYQGVVETNSVRQYRVDVPCDAPGSFRR